jgi:hypothetical protein
MASIGTFGLLRWIGHRADYFRRVDGFELGDPVQVCRGRSPLAGLSGTVAEVTPNDPYGTYLVQFENGLQFRYQRKELVASTCITRLANQDR